MARRVISLLRSNRVASGAERTPTSMRHATKLMRTRPNFFAGACKKRRDASFASFIMILRIAYLPALAVITLAEVRQLRLCTCYSVCGLLIGVCCNIILVYDDVRNAFSFAAFANDPLMVFIAYTAICGAVAGLCYWRIAGRHAGS
jgi:hypothetical protein